jgi:AraC-like DNA-binding protein
MPIGKIANYHNDLNQFPLYAFYFDQNELDLHTHDFIELVYVQRGHCQHIHQGHRYPIHAGDCFVINTGESHGYERIDRLRIVNILFKKELLEPHLPLVRGIGGFTAFFSLEPLFRHETAFRYKLHLGPRDRLRVEALIGELIHELQERIDGYRAACTGLFLQIVTFVSRSFNNQGSSAMTRDLDGKAEAVSQAIGILETNFESELSLQEVADSVCLSVSRLSHLFKETTGMSLMDYLLRFRLDRARELLGQGSLNVSEIAYSVGFHDPGYVSRAFRKYFGYPPSRVQKSAV